MSPTELNCKGAPTTPRRQKTMEISRPILSLWKHTSTYSSSTEALPVGAKYVYEAFPPRTVLPVRLQDRTSPSREVGQLRYSLQNSNPPV
eukprot:7102094-Pyramimonas_sp.AAC.1